ncbi:hypothetical protein PMAYCL1PPCAC_13570, partial [Pristionchus mayeri]
GVILVMAVILIFSIIFLRWFYRNRPNGKTGLLSIKSSKKGRNGKSGSKKEEKGGGSKKNGKPENARTPGDSKTR